MPEAPDPLSVAMDFVDRINARDVDSLLQSMTADHELIDTEGNAVRGLDRLREAWQGYYRLFPDYRVTINYADVRGDTVLLTGWSDGSLSDEGRTDLADAFGRVPTADELQGPAIWTAVVRGSAVAQWRVYVDTEQVRASLALGTDQ